MSKKRTLFSKFGFAVVDVASKDTTDVALNRVHLAADGSTAASNGRALLAVSGPAPAKAATFPDAREPEVEAPEDGIGMQLTDVLRVKRNFPGDKRPSLQYAQLTQCDTERGRVELMTTDGKTHQKVAGMPARGKFPKWKTVLADARKRAKKARICVDRQSLIKLLSAIEKACPDRGGFNPVFIEIGELEDSVVLRSHNYESGQTALGMVTPLQAAGWLEESAWEKEIEQHASDDAKPKKAGARRVSKIRRVKRVVRKER